MRCGERVSANSVNETNRANRANEVNKADKTNANIEKNADKTA